MALAVSTRHASGRAQPGSRRARLVRRPPTLGGTALAVVFFAITQTPSLMPRSWALQGAVAGITAAIGYAVGTTLGVALGALVRRVAPGLTTGTAVQRAWWVLAVTSGLLVSASLMLGDTWQRETRALVGMAEDQSWYVSLILALAVALVVALVVLARCVRLAARQLRRGLTRFVPGWVASAAAGLVAALVVGGFLEGFLYDSFVDAVDRSASVTNELTPARTAPPSSTSVSGGPDSLVEWSTLGYRGREFTASAAPVADLAAFSGQATEPIRVYVGLESADSARQRVDLALAELDRTGAWDRAVLAVVTTTGTGWVNPRVPTTLEYLRGGDTAVVALQYSYLPSWFAVLTDGGREVADAAMLIDAVTERWQALEDGDRPALLVYGESLGSRGTEAAFRDLDDLTRRTDGALLAGPTNANPIWRQAVASRDPASPIWLPVVDDGRVVRFAAEVGDLAVPATPWREPRVVYLQHSSDPVVWWSPSLLWDRPEWLHGERGPDVSPSMRWYPVVTFWQVVVDLVFANEVPYGHGHRYGPELVDGWVALAAPTGWTAQDTDRLRAVLWD